MQAGTPPLPPAPNEESRFVCLLFATLLRALSRAALCVPAPSDCPTDLLQASASQVSNILCRGGKCSALLAVSVACLRQPSSKEAACSWTFKVLLIALAHCSLFPFENQPAASGTETVTHHIHSRSASRPSKLSRRNTAIRAEWHACCRP